MYTRYTVHSAIITKYIREGTSSIYLYTLYILAISVLYILAIYSKGLAIILYKLNNKI